MARQDSERDVIFMVQWLLCLCRTIDRQIYSAAICQSIRVTRLVARDESRERHRNQQGDAGERILHKDESYEELETGHAVTSK